MSTKPCCLFLCKNKCCGLPNLLLLDTLRQPFLDRAVPPKDYPDVAFECQHCRRVRIYSLDLDSPYHQKSDTLVACTQSADAVFFVWLESCEGNCRFLLPVFVTPRTATREPINMEQWDWKELRCPNGHPISFPQTR